MLKTLILLSFFKYQLTFFSARWRLSTEWTEPAQARVYNSGLSQIKNNMNKATTYKMMDNKCGKYFKTAEKYEYNVFP